jgi:uncharacterized protein YxjI
VASIVVAFLWPSCSTSHENGARRRVRTEGNYCERRIVTNISSLRQWKAFAECLMAQSGIRVLQKFELAEVFGFEGRNKYSLADMNGETIGFAAEQGKGIIGWFLRQFLGHWRRFDVTIFDNQRKPVLQIKHPFRWFFQKMDVCLPDNRCIGSFEWKLFFFRRGFNVLDRKGQLLFEVKTERTLLGWRFDVFTGSRRRAEIAKQFSGVMSELFTDRDEFIVSFDDERLDENERSLLVAAAIFTDLQYFESKAHSKL